MLVLTIAVGACAAPIVPAHRLRRSGALRVLFIGNSLTAANDLPAIVESLSQGRGNLTVDATAITASNFSLEDHWNQGNARATIAKGNWSFVVLQQGPSALPESRVLLRDMRGDSPTRPERRGANGALHGLALEGQVADFDAVSESYALAARDVDGMLIPAGDAWREVWRRDPSDGPLWQTTTFTRARSGRTWRRSRSGERFPARQSSACQARRLSSRRHAAVAAGGRRPRTAVRARAKRSAGPR